MSGTISQQQFATTALNTRMAFVLELARRLHQYGTTAPRLEMAVAGVAQRLGLSADVWSSPTAVIISFADLAQGEERVATTTQVVRSTRTARTASERAHGVPPGHRGADCPGGERRA